MLNRLNRSLVLILLTLCTTNLPVPALDHPICTITAKNQKMPQDGFGLVGNRENFCNFNPKSYTSYLHIYPNGLFEVSSNSNSLILSDEEIIALPINTREDLEAAQSTALSYELMAEYDAAEKLYQRMLNALAKPSTNNEAINQDLTSNLSRIKLWEAAGLYEYENEYNKAALTYRQILLTISANQNIELENKLKLVSIIMHRLNSADYAKYNKRTYCRAQKIHDLYTKQLAYLQTAVDLDNTAWRLENLGLYDRAEKIYKQSLKIKEKSLGKNNLITLAARADLARLYTNEQRYAEAKNIYEQTLALYKRIANPGQPYTALLENYGDMLNHINQTSKADEIYVKAKITYSKL